MSKRNKKQRDPKKNATPLQPGEKLRLAREARGLSVDDVAARLKLNEKKINAMEQGDVAGIATPVFATGYLRTYARLLELSEVDVLADFDELKPEQDAEVDSSMSVNTENYGKVASEMPSQFSLRDKPSGVRFGLIGFVAVLVSGVTYFMWPDRDDMQSGAARVTDVTVSTNVTEQLVETAVTRPAVVVEKEADDAGSVEAKIVQAENEGPAKTSAVNENLRVAEEAVSAPTPAPPIRSVSDGEKSELALIFNSDSWAEVQDALGQRLVFRLGKSGSRRVVTGVAPFMVQLGYVQGVDISYNGAAYDLSKYANRRSVRLRIGEAGDHMGNE